MKPKALHRAASIDESTIRTEDRVIPLWSLSGKVFLMADGETTLDELADALDQPKSEIWRAMDELADAGLMARYAPPVSGRLRDTNFKLSRREMVAQLACGLAASGVAFGVARGVAAQEPARTTEEAKEPQKAPAAEADKELAALKRRHEEAKVKHTACNARHEDAAKQKTCNQLLAKRKVHEQAVKSKQSEMRRKR